MRLKVAIGLGTFILGLFTVIVPTFAIPDCAPEAMAVPTVKPFEPIVRPQLNPERPLLSILCKGLVPLRYALCASAFWSAKGCDVNGHNHVRDACQLWCYPTMYAYKHSGCWDVSHSIRAAPLHIREVGKHHWHVLLLVCTHQEVAGPSQPFWSGPCHWHICNALAS